MKKLATLLLSGALACALLAGCSGGTNPGAASTLRPIARHQPLRVLPLSPQRAPHLRVLLP